MLEITDLGVEFAVEHAGKKITGFYPQYIETYLELWSDLTAGWY